jgi:hypothetical protein
VVFSAHARKNDAHFEILVKEIMHSKSSSPRNYRLTSQKIYSKCNSGSARNYRLTSGKIYSKCNSGDSPTFVYDSDF